jgi:hypothetical protein
METSSYMRVNETLLAPGGHNCPDGYAWAENVSGHGAATLSLIRMVEIDGRRLFHDVRMQFMTPANYLQSVLSETPKQKRMAPSTVTPSPVPKKNTNNHKMPVEILVERLQHGSRHGLKKGWYCELEMI